MTQCDSTIDCAVRRAYLARRTRGSVGEIADILLASCEFTRVPLPNLPT